MSIKTFMIFGLIILLSTSSVFAQWSGAPGRRNSPLSDSPCWMKPYLESTPEQLKSLEKLQRSFFEEISALRRQHLNLSHELHALLDYPKPDAKMILEKQNRSSEIQKMMDDLSIRYLLKARALFTPEQLSKLPSGCNLGFNYGRGRGWGQGMGQRNRF